MTKIVINLLKSVVIVAIAVTCSLFNTNSQKQIEVHAQDDGSGYTACFYANNFGFANADECVAYLNFRADPYAGKWQSRASRCLALSAFSSVPTLVDDLRSTRYQPSRIIAVYTTTFIGCYFAPIN